MGKAQGPALSRKPGATRQGGKRSSQLDYAVLETVKPRKHLSQWEQQRHKHQNNRTKTTAWPRPCLCMGTLTHGFKSLEQHALASPANENNPTTRKKDDHRRIFPGVFDELFY